MEITTIQKYIHTSPRKLRLVADMVRKMQPNRALEVLKITPKDAALDLAKAIETVLANAKQSGLDSQSVSFKVLEVNESLKMRRFRAGTRGRVRPFKRRMAHIKIVVSDEIGKSVAQSISKSAIQQKVEEKITEVTEISKTETPTKAKKEEKVKRLSSK